METRELWHGGRLPGLISSIKPPTKGKWEMGPGLYLTTHYSTAQRYAKGNKATYKIQLARGTELSRITVDKNTLFDFIEQTYSKVNAQVLLSYYNNPANVVRSTKEGRFVLGPLLNLTINDELLSSSKAAKLTEFFVQCGADYSINEHFCGRTETVLVLYNPKLLKRVTAMPAKEWIPGWEPSDLKVKQLTEFFRTTP